MFVKKNGSKLLKIESYLRPKTIAKIIAKTATTTRIIPIIINNFFK
jgi:hypothetical protein